MDEARLREMAERMLAAFGGRRRLLAAALLAVAVVAGLRALTPGSGPTIAVWAAAHDLTGGRPLSATDLRALTLPVAAVPTGALRTTARVAGRFLAGPVRRGEALTDVRLLEPSLLAALPEPGLVAVPVRVADGPAAAALAHAGDVVDVLAVGDTSDPTTTDARTVVRMVRVLSVPVRDPAGGDDAGLVVLATTPAQASALAAAATTTRLSLTLERP